MAHELGGYPVTAGSRRPEAPPREPKTATATPSAVSRVGGILAVLTTFLAVPLELRAETKTAAPSVSVGSRQEFVQLDLARPRACAENLCAEDARGRQWPLTLKASLQRHARRALASSRPEAGALAAIDVRTGRVLVLTEWPTPRESEQTLLTRSFPAASLFKLVTSAALIERARVPANQLVCTQGGQHRLETSHLLPPREGQADCGTFFEALGQSRNGVFAQLAHRYLKPEDLENFADRFGFGGPLPLETRIDFGHFASRDEPLGFARVASGFDGSTLSPLGAAYLAYVIANQGRAGPLRLLAIPDDPQGAPPWCAALQPGTALHLPRMMELTVSRGTSWRAFHDARGHAYLPGISVAGKTGTLGDDEVTLSWFVGFAPSRQPRIAVSVLLRNGAVWHKKANEVARDWLREYFAQRDTLRVAIGGESAMRLDAPCDPATTDQAQAAPTRRSALGRAPERCSDKSDRSRTHRAPHRHHHRVILAGRP